MRMAMKDMNERCVQVNQSESTIKPSCADKSKCADKSEWVTVKLWLTVLIKQHLGPCWVGCRDEGLIDVGHAGMM